MSANIAEFIGSYLSLECGDPLGTYQGEVENVDKSDQTISLKTPFHNGLKTAIPLVTISAKDIKDLKILKTQEQVCKENDSKVSKLPPKGKPAQIILNDDRNGDEENLPRDRGPRTPRKNQTFFSQPPNGKHEENGNRNKYNCKGQELKNGDRSDAKTPPRRSSKVDVLGVCQHSHGVNDKSPDRQNGRRNSKTKQYYVDDNGSQMKNGKSSDEDDNRRKRHNSGSFEPKVKSSPRKIEGRSKSLRARKDMECFSAPTQTILAEFDFEGNLALFDKAAIFQEIDAEAGTPDAVNSPKQEPKFRHDEMIVDTGKPKAKRQILVNGSSNVTEYTTDEGFVVPSICQDLHEKLLGNAEKCGITVERRTEAVGRTAASMALQVLGGVNRINFENSHQLPTVVVLCGPHVQGAQGACCARHLANHNLPVTLVAPNMVKMHDVLDQEIKLFQETDGVVITNYKDLPVDPVDLVICALDSHHTHLRSQAWYQAIVQWASQSKAPLLTLDPPGNQTIPSKWALAVGLPFTYGDAVGKLYLGDVGIPSKVFSSAGVKYSSPFGHKFVIPLHNT